jgi:peptidoglycan/xylan/chitin deacetylase (PgdA/CDA1 family)
VGRLLVYHNVCHEPDPIFGLPAATFARQMRFLARHYQVVPLAEIVAMATGRRPWLDRAVALTFDDGYEDNHRVAWPILREYDLPATIFLATDAVETGRPVWLNALHFAVMHTRRTRLELPPELPGAERTVALGAPAQRRAVALRVMDQLYDLPPEPRLALTQQLLRALDVNPEGLSPRPSMLRMLSWDQVREMVADERVTFGSHGTSHSILSRLDDTSLREELATSKAAIERETGSLVQHLAYPNGQPGDYDARAARYLAELGYEAAVTMSPGLVTARSALFELPRIGYNGPHGTTLAKRLEQVGTRQVLQGY